MRSNIRALPLELPQVFSATAARLHGIRADRIKGKQVERLLTGIYVRRTLQNQTPRQADREESSLHPAQLWVQEQRGKAALISEWLPPGWFFSHHTAAALWGLPLVSAESEQVDVGCIFPNRGPRRVGIRTHCLRAPFVRIVRVQGMPVTDPASTWALLASTMSLQDGIALGDAVLHRDRYPGTNRFESKPLAVIGELADIANIPHRRGRAQLLQLVPLLSDKAASPPESHLRLLLLEWKLPHPELDVDVYNDAGLLLGCSELAYPSVKLAIEYESHFHRTDAAQWNRDIQKYQDYVEAGWEVIRVTSDLLYLRPELLRHQITQALVRRSKQLS